MRYVLKPLTVMAVFFTLILLSTLFLGQSFFDIFAHNYILNILIFTVFFIGVGLCFFQIVKLKKEYIWLEQLEKEDYRLTSSQNPEILKPLHIALGNQSLNSLGVLAIKSILSSVEQRLENEREFNRYLVGLCVFLGLVGTFWGLSKTITAIASVISGIDINATDIKDAFQNLKAGLQAPLKGMGYAFSSSLFGLTGSLVLSFLDLQVLKAYNHFQMHLEESISIVSKETVAQSNGSAYSSALIEQLSESMVTFQTQIDRAEESRYQTSKMLQSHLTAFGQVDMMLKSNMQMMEKIIQQQFELQQTFSLYMQNQQDTTIRDALLKIDANTHNILSELSQGRIQATEELSKEIRLISKTISALANES
ncbi:MAG: hypothetical protein KBD31_04830 [Proteobacteria bacterium]|nr:hypothetical protein [Pseudomonadota bacterium]